MIIGILKEITDYEQRVAATPESVKKFNDLGFKVRLEKDAGAMAGFSDHSYREAGAAIVPSPEKTAHDCDILLKIEAPLPNELDFIPDHTVIIADFRYFNRFDNRQIVQNKKLTCYALEKIPRISRAQNMDILSSQDNLAGYKAVLEAVNITKRAVPMMITAAGSITPAKILIVGIGVAGLQAIATAKRMGGMVFASDIRSETREQAESLGARFVANNELSERMEEMNIIITAAGSPGAAPKLFDSHLADKLLPGTVVIDISGNFKDLTSPQTISEKNVTIVSDQLMPALLSHSASRLFAGNLFNFVQMLYPKGIAAAEPDFTDPIINQTCICYQGKMREETK